MFSPENKVTNLSLLLIIVLLHFSELLEYKIIHVKVFWKAKVLLALAPLICHERNSELGVVGKLS